MYDLTPGAGPTVETVAMARRMAAVPNPVPQLEPGHPDAWKPVPTQIALARVRAVLQISSDTEVAWVAPDGQVALALRGNPELRIPQNLPELAHLRGTVQVMHRMENGEPTLRGPSVMDLDMAIAVGAPEIQIVDGDLLHVVTFDRAIERSAFQLCAALSVMRFEAARSAAGAGPAGPLDQAAYDDMLREIGTVFGFTCTRRRLP